MKKRLLLFVFFSPFFLYSEEMELNLIIDRFIRTSQWSEASVALKQYLKSNPLDHEAYAILSSVESELHRYTSSISAMRKAISYVFNNEKKSEYYYNLSIIYYKEDMLEAAIECNEIAMKLNPTLPNPYYLNGIMWFHKNELENANKSWQKYLTYSNNPELKEKINKIVTMLNEQLAMKNVENKEMAKEINSLLPPLASENKTDSMKEKQGEEKTISKNAENTQEIENKNQDNILEKEFAQGKNEHITTEEKNSGFPAGEPPLEESKIKETKKASENRRALEEKASTTPSLSEQKISLDHNEDDQITEKEVIPSSTTKNNLSKNTSSLKREEKKLEKTNSQEQQPSSNDDMGSRKDQGIAPSSSDSPNNSEKHVGPQESFSQIENNTVPINDDKKKSSQESDKHTSKNRKEADAVSSEVEKHPTDIETDHSRPNSSMQTKNQEKTQKEDEKEVPMKKTTTEDLATQEKSPPLKQAEFEKKQKDNELDWQEENDNQNRNFEDNSEQIKEKLTEKILRERNLKKNETSNFKEYKVLQKKDEEEDFEFID